MASGKGNKSRPPLKSPPSRGVPGVPDFIGRTLAVGLDQHPAQRRGD